MVGKEFGAMIKDAGVKQCELSKRARLSSSVVSEILSGKRVPTEEQISQLVGGLEEICTVLEVVNSMRFRLQAAQKI
jgi:transcriptional regulator with XRE-family HTH domain